MENMKILVEVPHLHLINMSILGRWLSVFLEDHDDAPFCCYTPQ
jgi:hypothetical protein